MAGSGIGPAAAQSDPDLIEAGRTVVLGPPPAACGRCHGKDGAGDERAAVPRIGGQSWFYLRKQLDDFAAGTRPSEVMAPIARALTPEQRFSVSLYYEAQRGPPWPPLPPHGDPEAIQIGGALSGAGAPERGVRACILCHAAQGRGFPPAFPYLAGQVAAYTARQMQLWKQGLRRNDPLDVMGVIGRALSDEEIEAIAVYFSRVRPPVDSLNKAEPADPVPPAPIPGTP
jgi:cytochrome c553